MLTMNEDLASVFSALSSLKVGVIGDFTIDAYFDLETQTGERSLETGKPVHYGAGPKTSLGGAGNLVQNLHALGIQDIVPFGIYSNDVWGREMIYQLQALDIDTTSMVCQQDGWDSCTYVKPMLRQEEQSRIDFGFHNMPHEGSMKKIFDSLEDMLPSLDVLLVNRQLTSPLLSGKSIQRISGLAEDYKDCSFFADLREGGQHLQNMTLKVNIEEAAAILDDPSAGKPGAEAALKMTGRLSGKTGAPILLTRGEGGIIYVADSNEYVAKGIYVSGEKDIVGAGDTALSAFSVSLSAGASPDTALKIANLAAAVTISKLGETGVASPEEIMGLQEDYSYIYHPAKATDRRKAQFAEGTDIEIVEPLNRQDAPIQHVIFDNDGTISTLRQGWESVMRPVMIKSICGDQSNNISAERLEKISESVCRFIDESTGIQTIVQMQGLVEMICREGLVPEYQIKSAGEYKAIYLDALMKTVSERIRRLKKGERTASDFTINGAVAMAKRLHEKDIRLYMASGTDQKDVKAEASALGYAELFREGIYGSKGNEIGDAKKIVIRRILQKNPARGENLMIIGDGPVEMREGRKVGALCVGIASDEIRRYGLNETKRTRLIRAGAHVVIPDFSQQEELLSMV